MTKNFGSYVIKPAYRLPYYHNLTSYKVLMGSNVTLRTFLLVLPFLFSATNAATAQTTCSVSNVAFSSGEELNFKVVYNWGPLWLESAEASFKVSSGSYGGNKCYVFNGSGSTYSRYDWFFKVHDVFESHVDSSTFRPLKFRAEIEEGSKNDKHLYLFNNVQKKLYTIITYGEKPPMVDTVPITPCTVDVLTAIYFARNIDYSNCRVNDTIGISIAIDGKVYPLYVRYLGKEKYTSPELGTYNCIKFRPLLVEGTIFRKGEHMNVWVSDDKNKIPLYIETAIIVGSVKVSLMSYKGLRHAQEAKLK